MDAHQTALINLALALEQGKPVRMSEEMGREVLDWAIRRGHAVVVSRTEDQRDPLWTLALQERGAQEGVVSPMATTPGVHSGGTACSVCGGHCCNLCGLFVLEGRYYCAACHARDGRPMAQAR